MLHRFGAADADVLVGAAEAAHGVALKVGQGQKRVVVGQVAAHGHLIKPLAPPDGEHGGALLVQNVHGAEGPAVDLKGLAVLLGGVAVPVVIGVGLYDGAAGQLLLHQGLHPGAGDDVGAVLLAGVDLHGHVSGENAAHPAENVDQALGGQVPGEIDHGRVPRALVKGDIAVAAAAGDGRSFQHKKDLLNKRMTGCV